MCCGSGRRGRDGRPVVYGEVVVLKAPPWEWCWSPGEKKWGRVCAERGSAFRAGAGGRGRGRAAHGADGRGRIPVEVASPRKEGERAGGCTPREDEKERRSRRRVGPEGKRVGEEEVQGEELVEKLSGKQIEWGPRWRWIEKVQRWEGGAEGVLRGPEGEEREEGPVHPAMLDNGFAVALSTAMEEVGEEPKLPWGVERIRMRRRARGRVRCEAVLRRSWEEGATADLRMVEEGVGTVLSVEGFTVRRAPREAFL